MQDSVCGTEGSSKVVERTNLMSDQVLFSKTTFRNLNVNELRCARILVNFIPAGPENLSALLSSSLQIKELVNGD